MTNHSSPSYMIFMTYILIHVLLCAFTNFEVGWDMVVNTVNPGVRHTGVNRDAGLELGETFCLCVSGGSLPIHLLCPN